MHSVISDMFLARGARFVTVTQGERGATVFSLDRTGEGIRELHDIHVVEKPLDPTGSGDVFLAAFTSAVLSGRNVRVSLSFAVRAAALSTLTRGAERLYDNFREKGIGL
jgi:sugar/nucleoside kinase (ribokinase family)